jgi:hypothetical protein
MMPSIQARRIVPRHGKDEHGGNEYRGSTQCTQSIDVHEESSGEDAEQKKWDGEQTVAGCYEIALSGMQPAGGRVASHERGVHTELQQRIGVNEAGDQDTG